MLFLHEVIFFSFECRFPLMQFCERMACVPIMVQLLLLLHVAVTHAVTVNQDSITALTSFMIQNHAKSSVIFGCWKKAGKIQYRKFDTNTTACPSLRMWLLSFSLSECVTRVKWIQFTSFNPISLNPILILSSALCLLFQMVLLPQIFKPKLYTHMSSLPCKLHGCLSHLFSNTDAQPSDLWTSKCCPVTYVFNHSEEM